MENKKETNKPNHADKILNLLCKKQFVWHTIEAIEGGYHLECPFEEVYAKTNLGKAELSQINLMDVYVTNNGYVQLEDGFGLDIFIPPGSDIQKMAFLVDAFHMMYVDLRIENNRGKNETRKEQVADQKRKSQAPQSS